MAESVSVVYRIPTKLIVIEEPHDAMEDEPFVIQPKINVLDASVSLSYPGSSSSSSFFFVLLRYQYFRRSKDA